MRKVVLLIFVVILGVLLASPAHAQKITASLTAQGASCPASTSTSALVVSVANNWGGGTFTLAGTWSGTVTFYASGDNGATFQTLNVTPSNSTTAVTTSTSNGLWQRNVTGYTQVCVLMSTYTSGSATVSFSPSLASAMRLSQGNSGPSWAQVNDKAGTGGGGTSAATTAFANALTPGSVIVVQQNGSTGFTGGACSDTAGNTYADSGEGVINGGSNSYAQQMFVAPNTHTTASNVVTCTLVSGSLFHIEAAEFYPGNGFAAPSVDIHKSSTNASTTGGANTLSVTSGTTTTANDLIVAAFEAGSLNVTVGTSPNAFSTGSTLGSNLLEYFQQPSAGAINPTASNAGSDTYCAIMVAIKV